MTGLAHPSQELLREVFDYVLNHRDFLDTPESCAARVAAELVAAQLGHPSRDVPPDLDADEKLPFQIDVPLRESARRAIGHILYLPGHSELRELGQESGS
jgi:hypothetical protein